MTRAPAPDWDDLAGLLAAAKLAFGDPKTLWEDHVVERELGLALRAWLRALEGLARLLLLVMALGMKDVGRVKRSEAERTRQGGAAARGDADAFRRLRGDGGSAPLDPPCDHPCPEASESGRWAGVAFRVLPPPPPDARPRAQRRIHRFIPARRLAFRLEALIRVAADPARFARRLAGRLRAKPALVPRILQRPREDRRSPPCARLVDDALAAARAAAIAFAPETG